MKNMSFPKLKSNQYRTIVELVLTLNNKNIEKIPNKRKNTISTTLVNLNLKKYNSKGMEQMKIM